MEAKSKAISNAWCPKNNAGAESLKYLGSKAIASLKRNNLPIPATSGKQPAKSVTSAPPVFKVSGTYFQLKSVHLLSFVLLQSVPQACPVCMYLYVTT